MNKRMEAAKPALISLAQDFTSCLETKDVAVCSSFTSEDFQKSAPLSEWELMNEKIRKVLGKRVSAELDQKSLNAMTFKSIKGDTLDRITARFKVMYDNDPFVIEKYSFRYDPRIGHYQIDGFNVESKLFIK